MYIFVSYLQCISKDGRNKLMTPPTVTMLSRARSAPLSAEHNGLFWQVFPQFRNLNKIWLNSNIFWKRYSSSKEIWNKNCKYQIKFVCWIHYPFFLNFVVKLVTIFEEKNSSKRSVIFVDPTASASNRDLRSPNSAVESSAVTRLQSLDATTTASGGNGNNTTHYTAVATDCRQSHYREVPKWGVSNVARHNWKCFLAYKEFKVFNQNVPQIGSFHLRYMMVS